MVWIFLYGANVLGYVWSFAHTELICLYLYLKPELEDFFECPSLVHIA